MINLIAERAVPLSHAARAWTPARGLQTHVSTLLRWCRDGVRGPAGVRVYLDHVRIGRGWFTSMEALQRFADALTVPSGSNHTPQPRLATRQNVRSHFVDREPDARG